MNGSVYLQNNSMIRKIDDLGRIVIPKDLRKKLHISEGEDLELSLLDNAICLKKYSSLLEIKNQLSNIISTIERNLHIKAIITDRNEVLSSSFTTNDNKLLSIITNTIMDREHVIAKDIIKLNITQDLIIEGYISYYPIIVNSTEKGLLIFIADKNYSFIEPIIKLVTDIISIIIESS